LQEQWVLGRGEEEDGNFFIGMHVAPSTGDFRKAFEIPLSQYLYVLSTVHRK
jgi:hypothetical protein